MKKDNYDLSMMEILSSIRSDIFSKNDNYDAYKNSDSADDVDDYQNYGSNENFSFATCGAKVANGYDRPYHGSVYDYRSLNDAPYQNDFSNMKSRDEKNFSAASGNSDYDDEKSRKSAAFADDSDDDVLDLDDGFRVADEESDENFLKAQAKNSQRFANHDENLEDSDDEIEDLTLDELDDFDAKNLRNSDFSVSKKNQKFESDALKTPDMQHSLEDDQTQKAKSRSKISRAKSAIRSKTESIKNSAKKILRKKPQKPGDAGENDEVNEFLQLIEENDENLKFNSENSRDEAKDHLKSVPESQIAENFSNNSNISVARNENISKTSRDDFVGDVREKSQNVSQKRSFESQMNDVNSENFMEKNEKSAAIERDSRSDGFNENSNILQALNAADKLIMEKKFDVNSQHFEGLEDVSESTNYESDENLEKSEIISENFSNLNDQKENEKSQDINQNQIIHDNFNDKPHQPEYHEYFERENNQKSILTKEAEERSMRSISKILETQRRIREEKRQTVDDLVLLAVTPMLQEWIDKNLPKLVEVIVEREIAKLINKTYS